MKTFLKGLAGKLGYRITRLDSRIEIDSPWGPNVLLYALEDLRNRSDAPLRIVQIGAHDGSDQDPLQPFLTAKDCDAILIEPMDAPYAALGERYRGHARIHTVQAAISETPGKMEMHYIVDGAGNPDLTLFSSFDRATTERNLSARQVLDADLADHTIQTKPIEARTLKSVLVEHGMDSVDAVVVDAEGMDHAIVRGFLRDGVEPRIIRFEYCNLSRRDFYDLRDLLRDRGYEIVRAGIDIYCQKAGLLR